VGAILYGFSRYFELDVYVEPEERTDVNCGVRGRCRLTPLLLPSKPDSRLSKFDPPLASSSSPPPPLLPCEELQEYFFHKFDIATSIT
jgi:hypothetical protein